MVDGLKRPEEGDDDVHLIFSTQVEEAATLKVFHIFSRRERSEFVPQRNELVKVIKEDKSDTCLVQRIFHTRTKEMLCLWLIIVFTF